LAFLATCGLLSCAFLPLHAQDAPEPEEPPAPNESEADAVFSRFRSGSTDIATLAEVLPLMADPERRQVIRAALVEIKSPPRSDLVTLLQHPVLATRLGALELLEELADGDFSFNPWLPADSPENHAAHARWQAWAGDPESSRSKTGSLYSDDQRRAYLRDLIGEDADKASRARRMLEAEGLSAVGFLESFLASTPTLSPVGRTRVREAQYQITLSRPLAAQAAITARHLAFGSRDQLLAALNTTRSAGVLALPILRDFITHPDPLVRETAIDALLITGGEAAVPIIAPLLAAEPDVNVIHGALRRLKDIRGPETEKLVTTFLSHPDEDLLISAIQTCISLGGRDEYSVFGNRKPKASKSPTPNAVLATLADPRWRVRATALEYVAKATPAEAKDACIKLLEDPDEFVRFAAIRAIAALGAKEALPKLKSLFLADETMAGPVIEGYGALKAKPDAELLEKLRASSVDAKLAAIRAIENSETLGSLAFEFSADENLDVACAALRQIASNEDHVKSSGGASTLVAALRSNSPEKREAVLERLNLPAAENTDPAILDAIASSLPSADEPTALDPLYDAFLLPGAGKPDDAGSAAATNAPKPPKIPAAQKELIAELTRLATPDASPNDRFRAALNLARAGHAVGFTTLLEDLPNLTTAQKTTISDRLYRPSHRDALPLISALLRDPLSEVRSGAAECALSDEKARALIQLVFDELVQPGALLQPQEVYGYRFEYAVKAPGNARYVRDWVMAVFNSHASSTPLRILASIATRGAANTTILAKLREQSNSTDPLLRRAAWNALLTARPAELATSAEAIAADPEAFVRETLPNRVAKVSSNYWTHRFSDSQSQSDSRWIYNETKPRLTPAVTEQLRRLAGHDPSPLIRFEASFALLSHGSPVSVPDLAALLPSMPPEIEAQRRITSWLSDNASRATPALAPLLQAIDPSKIDASKLKTLNARVGQNQSKGFATFASLAETPPEAASGDELLAPEDGTGSGEAPDATPREALHVVYFQKPGCPECTKAKRELTALKADFPLLKITEYNILDASATLLNQALCGRFNVPSADHNVSPAIFAQAGFVIRNEITPRSIAELLARSMDLPQDDSWFEIDREETAAAADEVTRRYQAFTLPIVIGAGLLDGINPCAFATIIFFLSYLQIARRTPREMLMVGAAFISAVFLAYLGAGLLLHGAIGTLANQFAGVQRWMNIGFALLAIVAAILSFRDAVLARRGRLDEMTLQLPGFLKTRIRGVIRTGAKARNFVIAAFISGVLISLLELACTGQVYAPIIYQIQRGRLDAVLWLVIYNLAFITPLVVIFLLAYGGLRSETLIRFQQQHTAAIKIALGLLFLVLGAFILLGPSL
jgi:cytochrome c biogenesis protein CcdA/HEAT repeat protein/glutaredoxin